MKVGIYTRCSTNLQDLDSQLFDLREYSKRSNYEIFKEYSDIESGSKENRAGLISLMEDAHKKKFDIVLVWRFDRFSRSLKQLVTSLDFLKSKGIKFISYNDNIDTTTPSGEAMFGMIGVMAQFERRIIQERVNAGIRKAKAKGTKLGRPKAKVNVYKVMQLRYEGLSYRKIGEILGLSYGTVKNVLDSVHK